MDNTITRVRPARIVTRRKLDPALRERIAEAVEQLIATLDATEDTDTDTAADDLPCDGDDDAEPSLGSVDNFTNQEKWSAGADHDPDREGDEHDGCEPEDEGGESVTEDDEDGGDLEPDLVSAEGHKIFAQAGGWVTDGEEGGLSVTELDALRAKRAARKAATAPLDGDSARLVMVTRGGPSKHSNVRALTPEEQARYFGRVNAMSAIENLDTLLATQVRAAQ